MSETPPSLDEIQKGVVARLRRIEGQIRGIQGMVEQGKSCEEVLVQVKAVRAAMRSAGCLILQRYLIQCQREAANGDEEPIKRSARILAGFLDA